MGENKLFDLLAEIHQAKANMLGAAEDIQLSGKYDDESLDDLVGMIQSFEGELEDWFQDTPLGTEWQEWDETEFLKKFPAKRVAKPKAKAKRKRKAA